MPSTDRALRQRDLVPPDRLAQCHTVLIGVGAVGRQVALQLAALGVPSMTLYDPDTVEEVNLAPQGFWESDLGRPKVEAVADICRRQNPELDVDAIAERFRTAAVRGWPSNLDVAVFCCVDSIETRKRVWEAVRVATPFFADGRMNGEVIRVLASDRPSVEAYYPRTLFPAREAFAGACSARSTIYAANIAAGLMLAQFARWLRGVRVVPDQLLNLAAAEYTANDPTN